MKHLILVLLFSTISCSQDVENSNKVVSELVERNQQIKKSAASISDNTSKIKCKLEPLLTCQKNIDNLNTSIIFDFLNTFSVVCQNNVEFSEWSNELLFEVMDKNPEMFIQVLSENITRLDTAIIFKEIEVPIHDLIDSKTITEKINILDTQSVVKYEIIKRLKRIKI